MGETQVSLGDRAPAPPDRPEPRATTRVTRTTTVLGSLFPRFDPPITPEFYKLSGKLRAITNVLFLVANFVQAPRAGALGLDLGIHHYVLATYTAIHLLDGVLGVWLWRGVMPARAMRRITYACIGLETTAVLMSAWLYGAVNSPFLGIEIVFVLVYRIGFDFRIGMTVFTIIFAGQWTIVGLEVAGVIPSQPVSAMPLDAVYRMPGREIGAMVNLSFAMVLTFAVSNWAVGRLHHRDLMVRMLREELAAAGRGRVGQHTGRTLRDTYALGALLGRGGMGEVYAGTHLRTQRKVAIKMLHAHLIRDESTLQRFRREAEVMGQLGSENICSVIDVDQDAEQPFLVLELIEGESLHARLLRGKPNRDELADIIEQIAAGLDVAHRAGVIHRDLKPENVFLCPLRDGGTNVKILDFGVSKLRGNVTALTNEAAILGTPDYMSPEQALGNADEVDATSDVFALGGLTYKCITGHRPFDGDSIPAVLRQICEQEPRPLVIVAPELPASVSDVLAIAMAKKPGERYGVASELARDLRAALSDTLEPMVRERASKLSRGKPARAAAV